MTELLSHLSDNQFPVSGQLGVWQFHKVTGGANNLLYCASKSGQKIAIKFTVADARGRAEREFKALHALQQHVPGVAPEALHLDQHSHSQPVVVQTWLNGNVLQAPPGTDSEWRTLLSHFTTFHTLTPTTVKADLPGSFVNMASVSDGIGMINGQLTRLPADTLAPRILLRIDRLSTLNPTPFKHPLALCKTDSNYRNFIWQGQRLVSVDWENSGWGDPHFEIAELMAHPAYLEVKQKRWHWLVSEYCQLIGMDVKEALYSYAHLMLVWWLIRFARYLYELPQGKDTRLQTARFMTLEALQAKQAHYLQRAEQSEARFLG